MKLKKLKGIGKIGGRVWGKQKEKAALFLKFMEPIMKPLVRQHMQRDWFRHIDKALEGRSTERDEKHWVRMSKFFEKNITGVPSRETVQILDWMKDFTKRVGRECVSVADKKQLRRFKEYMESCKDSAMDNYIFQNKLVEVENSGK